jgi:hypothetical protein
MYSGRGLAAILLGIFLTRFIVLIALWLSHQNIQITHG